MENLSTLNSLLVKRAPQDTVGTQQPVVLDAPKSESVLGKHKGKLAVGAAAMLGLAIFYKWREHQLAREDPEEYAWLQRLKLAVKNEEPKQPGYLE